MHPYKNIYNRIYFTPKISDEISVVKTADEKSTELSDDVFMFNDGSIEYYTKLILQQPSLEDITNVLRPLFPHPR